MPGLSCAHTLDRRHGVGTDLGTEEIDARKRLRSGSPLERNSSSVIGKIRLWMVRPYGKISAQARSMVIRVAKATYATFSAMTVKRGDIQ